jgi:arsenate reductase
VDLCAITASLGPVSLRAMPAPEAEPWRSDVPALVAARAIAFVCVANSARSQIAEGLARALAPAGVAIHSAGWLPALVHPLAVRALAEIDVDISHHRSKGLGEIPLASCDVAVLLCAEEQCPLVPAAVRRVRWELVDPAGAAGDGEARLEAFRSTRDELRRRLLAVWPAGR